MFSLKVHFTNGGVKMRIPQLTNPNELVTIWPSFEEITKLETYSSSDQPLKLHVLFFSTTSSACKRIRKALKLDFEVLGLFYDCESDDPKMQKIVILPDEMPEGFKEFLTYFYSDIITELDTYKANSMLVKASPSIHILMVQKKLQEFTNSKKDILPNQLKLFECPVCLEIMKSPKRIYGCSSDHYICSDCLQSPDLKCCPICREDYETVRPQRRFQSEQILATLI